MYPSLSGCSKGKRSRPRETLRVQAHLFIVCDIGTCEAAFVNSHDQVVDCAGLPNVIVATGINTSSQREPTLNCQAIGR
jgi:hypothetical protein